MRAARKQFRDAGLDSPELDARLLAEIAFELEGAILAVHENQMADLAQLDVLAAFVERRLSGEPVARIVGVKEFYGLKFKLNVASLVPRPETELLVDLGLKFLPENSESRILDLGTGTGCIAISLLHHLPNAHCVAVDLSEEALVQAGENARLHDVGLRFETRTGSWYGPLKDDERFDLIVANPPYIAAHEILGLEIEVSAYDPILALSAGTNGLEPFGPIVSGAKAALSPGGMLAMECGLGQAEQIGSLCAQAGFSNIDIHNDLAGIPRVVVAID